MSDNRTSTTYNKLIAKHEGEFIFLDDIFRYSDGFKGATGTLFLPVSKEDYEERTSPENVRDYLSEIWQMQVAEGQTEQGLDDYVEDVLRYEAAEDIVFDSSYAHSDQWGQMRAKGYSEEDYPYFECTGGGRMFTEKNEFDEVYEPELLKLIEKQEKTS